MGKAILYLIIFSCLSKISFAKDCQRYIRNYEKQYNIPKDLLSAISNVESSYNPYAVNFAGKAYYFKTKEEAIVYVNDLLAKGYKSFDVGCLQINYRYHSKNFNSLDEMFEITNNIKYGANYLKQLHKATSNWREAVAKYHSSKEINQRKYTRQVLEKWVKL
ncbi:MAG: transglycosylase SLT domain-containing protein [Sphingobacteriia bacterium]|nr:transglycosylase SLT domain-containing protein [Sphingobacteriia bacterium]